MARSRALREAWRDPSILRVIDQEARHVKGARRRLKFRLAAREVGIVESRGQELAGGDADSQNWRQERESGYGAAWRRTGGPLNTRASVRRFRQEFEQHDAPGKKSYEVAADVQRPRADLRGRYHEEARTARALLGEGGGGKLSSKMRAASSSAGVGTFDSSGGTSVLPEPVQRPQIQASPLQAPSFSAQAPVAQGYQAVDGGGGPAPRQSLSEQLAQGQTVDFTPAQPKQPSGSSGGGGARGGSKRGKVKFEAGADRPGVPTRPEVKDFLERVAGRTGRTVKVGTGSRHSQRTVTGNVSDHWEGRGADVPATGQRLIELGQAALIEAGMGVRKARKQKGGLYNLTRRGKRIQIIFNVNSPDTGDHTNHLHVGFGS